jgi:protein associated with RNAse G/E
MHYSNELDEVVKSELSNLIEMKKASVGPFDKKVIDNYYEKYKKIAGIQ